LLARLHRQTDFRTGGNQINFGATVSPVFVSASAKMKRLCADHFASANFLHVNHRYFLARKAKAVGA
jgi:hypothetical protein